MTSKNTTDISVLNFFKLKKYFDDEFVQLIEEICKESQLSESCLVDMFYQLCLSIMDKQQDKRAEQIIKKYIYQVPKKALLEVKESGFSKDRYSQIYQELADKVDEMLIKGHGLHSSSSFDEDINHLAIRLEFLVALFKNNDNYARSLSEFGHQRLAEEDDKLYKYLFSLLNCTIPEYFNGLYEKDWQYTIMNNRDIFFAHFGDELSDYHTWNYKQWIKFSKDVESNHEFDTIDYPRNFIAYESKQVRVVAHCKSKEEEWNFGAYNYLEDVVNYFGIPIEKLKANLKYNNQYSRSPKKWKYLCDVSWDDDDKDFINSQYHYCFTGGDIK